VVFKQSIDLGGACTEMQIAPFRMLPVLLHTVYHSTGRTAPIRGASLTACRWKTSIPPNANRYSPQEHIAQSDGTFRSKRIECFSDNM